MKHYSNNILAIEKPTSPSPPQAEPLREGIEKRQTSNPLRVDPPPPPRPTLTTNK